MSKGMVAGIAEHCPLLRCERERERKARALQMNILYE